MTERGIRGFFCDEGRLCASAVSAAKELLALLFRELRRGSKRFVIDYKLRKKHEKENRIVARSTFRSSDCQRANRI